MAETLKYSGLLDNKVALVVGGSKGIGAAICREFVEEGLGKLVVASRQRSSAEGVLEFAADRRVDVKHIEVDVSHREGVDMIINVLSETDTKLHTAVYTPAIRHDRLLGDYTWEEVDEAINTNLKAPFMLMNGIVGRRLYIEGETTFLNIGSIVGGETGNFGQSIYTVTKAGLHGLTMTASIELGNTLGLRVLTVEPGFIPTDFTEDVTNNPEMKRMLEQATPLKRLGRVEEVAHLVAFLASDKASFMTGTDVVIDGGLRGGAGAVFPLKRGNYQFLTRQERRVVNDLRRKQ